jgi:hypothetical protein
LHKPRASWDLVIVVVGYGFLFCFVIHFLEEGQDDVNSRQDVFSCIPPTTFSYTLLFCFPS